MKARALAPCLAALLALLLALTAAGVRPASAWSYAGLYGGAFGCYGPGTRTACYWETPYVSPYAVYTRPGYDRDVIEAPEWYACYNECYACITYAQGVASRAFDEPWDLVYAESYCGCRIDCEPLSPAQRYLGSAFANFFGLLGNLGG